MLALVSSLAVILAAATVALLWLYLQSRASLRHFRSVADLEAYKLDCEGKSRAAIAEAARLEGESAAIQLQITENRNRVARYQQLLGKFKTAADLQERIRIDTHQAKQLGATLQKLERASQLDEYLKKQEALITHRRSELDEISKCIGGAKSASEIAARVTYYENYLSQLKADIEAVEEAGELQEFGFYRSRFDFDTSDDYKQRLAEVRVRQKAMLKEKTACVCQTEWTVDGNKREGQKMVNQQVKLMLRAFNGECDAAVEKVRYNNVVTLEKRIQRSFEAINKLGETKRIYLVAEYCHLKYNELHLAYEYQEKKQEEREERQRIRDQMREEEKVAKEIEKAREDAERDEAVRMRHSKKRARN